MGHEYNSFLLHTWALGMHCFISHFRRLGVWGWRTTVFFCGPTVSSGPGSSQQPGFTITLRHTTLGISPLDEWSALRREFYMTTQHSQVRDIHAVGRIEIPIPISVRSQTHALDRAAAGIGDGLCYLPPKANIFLAAPIFTSICLGVYPHFSAFRNIIFVHLSTLKNTVQQVCV